MNYKGIIIGLSMTFLSLHSLAQNQKQISIGSKLYDQFYGLKYNFDAGSNSLNNMLLSKFVLGGNIDAILKETNQKTLKDKNIFGQSGDMSLYYRQENRTILGMKEMGFQVALEWHNLQEIQFGPQLYNLIFYGNSNVAGSQVDLSATNYQSLNYYQVKIGLNKILRNSKIGFNVDFNLGNNFSFVSFDNTNFYTSSSGDSLALDGDIKYKYLNLNGISPFTINGYGLGLDLFYTYDNSRLFKVEAKVENIGFISWNNNAIEYQQSEPIIWEGFEVPNLFDMPDLSVEKSPVDSIKEYITSQSKAIKYRSYTPVNMELKFTKSLVEDKIEALVLLKYRLFSNYRPMVLLQSNFLLNEQITLSPNVSYGGYSNFNMGFEFIYQLNNISELHLGTQYLSGFLFQNKLSGVGGFITFTYQI